MTIWGKLYKDIWRYIYFIQRLDTKDIKIGMSLDPVQRFIILQSQYNTTRLHLMGVLPEKVHFDKYMHRRFAHLHIGREWFSPAPDLLRYIDANATLDLPDLDIDRYCHELTLPPKRGCMKCGKAIRRKSMIVSVDPLTKKTGKFHHHCLNRLHYLDDDGQIVLAPRPRRA